MTSNKARRAQERRRRWRREYEAITPPMSELDIERTVWRRQLRNDGVEEAAIVAHLDDYVYEAISKRAGHEHALAVVHGRSGYTTPDDTRHRPTPVLAELRGPARATGQTAAAVKRGRTMTKSEHDQRDAS